MLSFLSKFTHSQEMRESKDEVLIGEIVRAMAHLGAPAIGFMADMGDQSIRFKPVKDSALHAIDVIVDRKTGGGAVQQALIGSKAVVTVRVEVKNYLADPDDLIKMYRTDLQNLLKMPILGEVRLDHQLNSVFATKKVVIDIDSYIGKGEASQTKLVQLLEGLIEELRSKAAPYKKG